MKKIVLDTNIFINPASYKFFGEQPDLAFKNFINLLSCKNNVSCYIPPSVYQELLKFLETNLDNKEIVCIQTKPPSSYLASIPAILFYEFIAQMRIRINKGLRIAEKYTRKALSGGQEQELIKSLREEFRTGVREGIIDSKEDFDLILLAKELNAYLATVDSGLISWAEKFGISCINANQLKEILQNSD